MTKPKGPDFIRAAHGKGRDALERTELPPLDELPAVNAEDTAQGLALRAQRGRPFQRGNQAAKNRKPGLACLGLPVDGADPRYLSALRKAKRLMQRRCAELAVLHGGHLGAGPSTMLANAALATAASRVLYEIAAASLDPSLFKQAAALADSARQQELTAVALAAREAAARVVDDAAELRRRQAEFQKRLQEEIGTT